MAKYEVICAGPQGQATYWDGADLIRKGVIVELDPEVVKVSATSMSLKPVDGAPVWRTRVDKDGVKTHELVTKK
jgi:hypothetical protein